MSFFFSLFLFSLITLLIAGEAVCRSGTSQACLKQFGSIQSNHLVDSGLRPLHTDNYISHAKAGLPRVLILRLPLFSTQRASPPSQKKICRMGEKTKANYRHKVGTTEVSSQDSLTALRRADDVLLAHLGYKAEFRREFSVGVSQHSPPELW